MGVQSVIASWEAGCISGSVTIFESSLLRWRFCCSRSQCSWGEGRLDQMQEQKDRMNRMRRRSKRKNYATQFGGVNDQISRVSLSKVQRLEGSCSELSMAQIEYKSEQPNPERIRSG